VDIIIKNLKGVLDKEHVALSIALKIAESELFADVFYVLSSLNQLHRLGFIDKYTEVPEGSEPVFLTLRDSGYNISNRRALEILSMSDNWDKPTIHRLYKFYKAYHNLKWDIKGNLITKQA